MRSGQKLPSCPLTCQPVFQGFRGRTWELRTPQVLAQLERVRGIVMHRVFTDRRLDEDYEMVTAARDFSMKFDYVFLIFF